MFCVPTLIIFRSPFYNEEVFFKFQLNELLLSLIKITLKKPLVLIQIVILYVLHEI